VLVPSLLPTVVPSSSSTLLCTQPTSTTLFPVLSKLTGSVLSFEDLTDNSIISSQISVKGPPLIRAFCTVHILYAHDTLFTHCTHATYCKLLVRVPRSIGWDHTRTPILIRVIHKVCPEEETKGKFHQNWS
jgi:hypothetical protein